MLGSAQNLALADLWQAYKLGLRASAVKSLKAGCHGGTLAPPAMGAHFSGLSLKKWPPSRAAL